MLLKKCVVQILHKLNKLFYSFLGDFIYYHITVPYLQLGLAFLVGGMAIEKKLEIFGDIGKQHMNSRASKIRQPSTIGWVDVGTIGQKPGDMLSFMKKKIMEN
jgi:hypothetical protein